MILILLSLFAFAETPADEGTLVLDARVPSEILIDGHVIAEVMVPGILSVELTAGEHDLRVYNNGNPIDFPIVVSNQTPTRVLIGRTGISTDGRKVSRTDEADLNIALQIRVTGYQSVQLRLDQERYEIAPGDILPLTVPAGNHRVSIRSGDGTAIWASGTLNLIGPDEVVLQLTEGRLPEVSGQGKFSSHSG